MDIFHVIKPHAAQTIVGNPIFLLSYAVIFLQLCRKNLPELPDFYDGGNTGVVATQK